MEEMDLFAQLRDVGLPPAPPEASSLPIVLAGLVVMAGITGAAIMILSVRSAWYREARSRLDALDGRDGRQALAETAALLRRIAMLKQGAGVVRLTGEAWLEALDRLFLTRFFTRGSGRVFGGNLYERGAQGPPLRELGRLLRRRALLPW